MQQITFTKRLLGIPVGAAVGLERLLRSSIAHRSHPPKSVLILQYNLALGYCVHLTPLFETIKRSLPATSIVVATHGMGIGVLRNSPYVDHLIQTPNVLEDFLGAVRSLKQQLKDHDLQPECCLTGVADQRTKIGLLAALTCGGWRGGFSVLPALYHCSIFYDPNLSLLANNNRLAGLVGVDANAPEPRVYFSPQDVETARKLVEPARADGRPVLVVVSRNSGGLPTAWHDDRWAETIRYAHERLGYNILYVGTASDAPAIQALQTLAGGIGTSLAGATSINQLAAVLALSDMVVSLTTGTMHVARAVGTPTLVLGLAWERPLMWLVTDRPHIRLIRGADIDEAPPDYRMDEISTGWVIRELTEMSTLFPPDESARQARVRASTSDAELLKN